MPSALVIILIVFNLLTFSALVIFWRRLRRMKRRKTKIWSEHELAERAIGLRELAGIMNKFNVDWHVSGGTALGIARNGDFIPWDWDVGVAVKREDFMNIWADLITELQNKGFEITLVRTVTENRNEKILMTKFGQEYEILSWALLGDYRVRKIHRRPSRFFDKVEYRNLRGFDYPLPSPLEDYLEEVYGDWRTPIRTSKRSVYFNQRNIMNRRSGLASMPRDDSNTNGKNT